MMKKLIFGCFLALAATTLFLSSCGKNDGYESANPYANYFYPWDTTMKVYLYRDVANGLDEQFQRVYCVKDQAGRHIVVEVYSADGRIIEAMNFNTDSLDVMDHMVVDRNGKKTKAEVFKYSFFPMDKNQESYFASRFSGFLDSTLILREVKKKYLKEVKDYEVLGEKKPALVTRDHIRMTNFNPFSKKETSLESDATFYYAEGYGLTEWHDDNRKVHYKLEKIMTQEEWIKIITR
jgi:hypothetical protein